MKFEVYSRRGIERMSPCVVPHSFISVITPEDCQAKLPTNELTQGVLRLAFHDVNPTREEEQAIQKQKLIILDPHGTKLTYASMVLFDDAMAESVVNFMHLWANTSARVFVHCDAGRSRSPAIAAALDKCIKGTDLEWFDKYTPNSRVYSKILQAWYKMC